MKIVLIVTSFCLWSDALKMSENIQKGEVKTTTFKTGLFKTSSHIEQETIESTKPSSNGWDKHWWDVFDVMHSFQKDSGSRRRRRRKAIATDPTLEDPGWYAASTGGKSCDDVCKTVNANFFCKNEELGADAVNAWVNTKSAFYIEDGGTSQSCTTLYEPSNISGFLPAISYVSDVNLKCYVHATNIASCSDNEPTSLSMHRLCYCGTSAPASIFNIYDNYFGTGSAIYDLYYSNAGSAGQRLNSNFAQLYDLEKDFGYDPQPWNYTYYKRPPFRNETPADGVWNQRAEAYDKAMMYYSSDPSVCLKVCERHTTCEFVMDTYITNQSTEEAANCCRFFESAAVLLDYPGRRRRSYTYTVYKKKTR